MAYRSPNGTYARKNTIRRQMEIDSVQAHSEKGDIRSESDEDVKGKRNSPSHERRVRSNPLVGLFGNGKPDNDKILIIALIVILAKEGADIKLLLALGYILM